MNATSTAAKRATTAEAHQFLTFRVGGEEYGIEILKVQEIKGLTTITPIPNAPPYVSGVMNLRGSVVPVMELRSCFGLPAREDATFAVIVVVKVGPKVVGLVADAVSEVLDTTADQIEPAPEIGIAPAQQFVTAVTRAGDRLVGLLAVERVACVGDLDTSLAA